jgi:hypothetical protein
MSVCGNEGIVMMDNWMDSGMLMSELFKYGKKWPVDQCTKFPPIWAHEAEDQKCVDGGIYDQRDHNRLGKFTRLYVEHGECSLTFGIHHQQREEDVHDGHENQQHWFNNLKGRVFVMEA